MERATLPGFLDDKGLRLLLFGGKGGVGKTTCAAATALWLARNGPSRSFLLVSTDPAHSLADSFGDDYAPSPSPLPQRWGRGNNKGAPLPSPVAFPLTQALSPPGRGEGEGTTGARERAGVRGVENLALCEIAPQESLARFKARHGDHLRTIALRGTFLDQADVTKLLDLSMPGLDEVMALLEIATWVKEDRYSCIVVDTAPAGHTLRLLGLPVVMRQWVATLDAMLAKHRYMVRLYRGAYRKDATDLYLEEMAAEIETLGALLRAPGRCRFVPVLLAEKLSLEITRMMVAELEQLNLPVREMVVNRLAPAQPLTLPSPITRCNRRSNGYPGEGSLHHILAPDGGEGWGEGDCPVCAEWASRQAVALEELTRVFSRYTLWGLPVFLKEVRGAERLTTVWEHARPLPSPLPLPSGERTKERGTPAVDHPASLPTPSMKLLLFAGKGGVGKTTLACASALRLAEEWGDKEILLFSIDPAHSLSTCLGQEIGPQAVRVAPGLTAIEIDAQAEYERLKRDYEEELTGVFERVTGQSGIDFAFDRDVMERIMDLAPPGLDEMLALTRIVEFLDQGRYDLFILDTAPTGHLLRFLEMPELIEEWLRTFFGLFLKYREVFRLPRISREMVELSKRVKQFRRILTDPKQAALMAVTIPTEMAYEETRDLVAACDRLGVAAPTLFVNMVTPASSRVGGGPAKGAPPTPTRVGEGPAKGAPPTPTCPTCSALRREEESVLRRYEEAFAGRHVALVFRQEPPPSFPLIKGEKGGGVERLCALGGQLYRSKAPVPFPETQLLMI